MKIAFLGTGSWGTAMANQLASKYDAIHMHSRNKELLEKMEKERENTLYLPGITLSSHLV